MGVYTYIEHTLGLTGSPRTDKIRDKIETNEQLNFEELSYLVNCTARWDTLQERTNRDSYKVNEKYEDESYELKELLKSIVTELQNVYYMKVDGLRKYRMEFNLFSVERNTISLSEIETEIRGYLDIVKDMQRDFDFNKDNIEVNASLKSKRYNRLTVSFTAKDSKEEVIKQFKEQIKEELEKENELLQRNLKNFN